ncbi:hypothetical protein [Enterococcus lemanii]|uniref:LXG domain-containing protein n=1 Tax=Enterococcus lemanii TaxID=1159752 RepID=A0ABV9MY14_9ENTE|nr:hypothetical protein [Enterococcus lemanii]NLM66304.1 hypothetical protein [Enterococcus sp.]
MRPNLGLYIQNINQIVQETEAIGENLNPKYEEIRQAIDQEQLAEISAEKISEIVETFANGTSKYEAMLKQVRSLRPPAQVLGIHKKFENSYANYVAGCQEMIASLAQGTVDVEAFNAAEEKQDGATDGISFAIQRMTRILLKK